LAGNVVASPEGRRGQSHAATYANGGHRGALLRFLGRVTGRCFHPDWNLLNAVERRIETGAMREIGGAICSTCGTIRLKYRNPWNLGVPGAPRASRRSALLASRRSSR